MIAFQVRGDFWNMSAAQNTSGASNFGALARWRNDQAFGYVAPDEVVDEEPFA